ncbi:hypothetical protein ACJOT3_32265, partial [Nocardiopsis sp. frass1]
MSGLVLVTAAVVMRAGGGSLPLGSTEGGGRVVVRARSVYDLSKLVEGGELTRDEALRYTAVCGFGELRRWLREHGGVAAVVDAWARVEARYCFGYGAGDGIGDRFGVGSGAGRGTRAEGGAGSWPGEVEWFRVPDEWGSRGAGATPFGPGAGGGNRAGEVERSRFFDGWGTRGGGVAPFGPGKGRGAGSGDGSGAGGPGDRGTRVEGGDRARPGSGGVERLRVFDRWGAQGGGAERFGPGGGRRAGSGSRWGGWRSAGWVWTSCARSRTCAGGAAERAGRAAWARRT